jgi:hypothetical protein
MPLGGVITTAVRPDRRPAGLRMTGIYLTIAHARFSVIIPGGVPALGVWVTQRLSPA